MKMFNLYWVAVVLAFMCYLMFRGLMNRLVYIRPRRRG